MNRSAKRPSVVTGLVVTFLSLLAPQIDAHEKGVLKLATRRLMPGDSVGSTGEHFGQRATLTIELAGIAGRTRLAEVRSDAQGRFRQALVVSSDVQPGTYRVVVIAADGDEVASVDVSVVTHALPPVPTPAYVETAPSARALALTRARSIWVTGGALVAIMLAFAAGAVLLLRIQPRRLESKPR